MLGHLWSLITNYPDLAIALLLATVQLSQIGLRVIKKLPEWADLSLNTAIVFMALLIVRFQYGSAISTEHRLSELRHSADAAQADAGKASLAASSAVTVSNSAVTQADKAAGKSQVAFDKSLAAGANAESARVIARTAKGESLNSLREAGAAASTATSAFRLASTAKLEAEAQRRALRSLDLDIELASALSDLGPHPPGSFAGGDHAGSGFIYDLNPNHIDSAPIVLAGSEYTSVDLQKGTWSTTEHLHLIDRGRPVGKDIHLLDGYKLLCLNVDGLLATALMPKHDQRIQASISLTVNGDQATEENSGTFYSAPYLTYQRLDEPKQGHLECLRLSKSVDDVGSQLDR